MSLGMPAGGSDGGAGKKPCCISHGFFESASRNPTGIVVVHAAFGSLKHRRESGEEFVSRADNEGSSPYRYPGDVCFTNGDLLSSVDSFSRRIRWVLDGGDDPDLFRAKDSAKQIVASVSSPMLEDRIPHIIGVCISPSVEYIVAVLSILRCGEAFFPLDPLWPEERIFSFISSSKTGLIIKCAPLSGDQQSEAVDWFVEKSNCSVMYINLKADLKREFSGPGLPWPCENRISRRFCYLMCTSGSTGKVKGVCGTEDGLLNRFSWMQGLIPLGSKDILLFKTSISFIDHLQEFLGAILTATTLIIPPFNVIKANPMCLGNFVKAYFITRMTCVPSLMKLVLPTLENSYFRDYNPLKVLILSGEILSVSLCRSLQENLPGTRILNLYGSTEVSGDCTYFDCQNLAAVLAAVPLSSVPIGIPISNCEITLVGEPDSPDEGEVYVSGACLFAGYLEGDVLNSSFKEKISGLQFKTGDFARRLRSGDLVFLGRHDRIVKINGQRVALEEIESVLKGHPEVRDAAVTYHGFHHGITTHLAAYFVMSSPEDLEKEHKPLDDHHFTENVIKSIRSWLFKKLPPVMIPSYYFLAKSLPILASGKIDHVKLSRLAYLPKSAIISFGSNQSYDSQLQIIKEVFCDALLVQEVEDFDDFFMMGGTSISAAQAAYKLGIDMRLLYMFPTPIKLLTGLLEHKELHEAFSSCSVPRKRPKVYANVANSFDLVTGKRKFLLQESPQSPTNAWVYDLSTEHNTPQAVSSSEEKDVSSIIRSKQEDSSLPPDSHSATLNDHGLWSLNCTMPKRCSFSRCNKIMHEAESHMGSTDRLWLSMKTFRSTKGFLQELWKVPLASCVDASPLLVLIDGDLYLLIGSHSHVFLCIEALCGSVRWKVLLEDRVECSAAITGDFSQVVVGCYKGKIYFLDFATGNISWLFQTDGEVKMQPIVDRSRNFVWCGSHDHYLYALDYREHYCIYKVSCGGSIFGSPFNDVVRKLVYAASTSGRVTAISLEVKPFNTLWTFEAGAPIFGSLTMDSKFRNVICCLVDGHVIALNSFGAVVWKAVVGGPIFAGACISPVLKDQILICSQNGRLYSFDTEGTMLWEYQTGDPITSSAYVDEQTEIISETSRRSKLVCVCSTSGSIHVIKISIGAKREGIVETPQVEKFAAMNLPGEIFSSPVMIGGRIFVGSRDDHVHCITVGP